MKNKLIILLVLVFANVFVFSGMLLVKDQYDAQKDKENAEALSTTYTNTNDSIKEVNFDALLEINEDVVGWIYIPDTHIDEPILKGKDNSTYIRTNLYRKHVTSGSIFMEEINSADFSDSQTILYGHHMKNGTKFSDLKYYVDNEYLSNHNKLYLFTPTASYSYTIVASSTIRKNSYLYSNEITVNDLISNANICALKEDDVLNNVLMLSTCVDTGSSDRYVVWANRDL